MYLIYLDKNYFGFTYSKKVVKLMKSIYPTVHHVPVNRDKAMSFDIQEMIAEHNQIRIYELDDMFDNKRQVISTDIEFENARIWINGYAIEKISMGSEAAMDIFNNLPPIIKMALGKYEPIDFMIAEGADVEDIYPLTYEGYLLYLEFGKERKIDELEKGLCVL